MRPKKKVLLINTCRDEAGVQRMVLETAGYRVFSSHTPLDAHLALKSDISIDVVVAEGCSRASIGTFAKSGIPVLVLLEATKNGALFIKAGAAHVIYYGTGAMANLRESVRILAAKKRGPKKQNAVDTSKGKVA